MLCDHEQNVSHGNTATEISNVAGKEGHAIVDVIYIYIRFLQFVAGIYQQECQDCRLCSVTGVFSKETVSMVHVFHLRRRTSSSLGE